MSQKFHPVRTTPVRAIVWSLVAFAALTGRASAGPARVTIRGNGTELGETPVIVALKAAHPVGAYRLIPRNDGPKVAARVFLDGGKSFLAMILPSVPAKADWTFDLEADDRPARPGTGVEFRPNGPNVEVLVDGKLVTVHHADAPAKPCDYPLIGPTGANFTREYPFKTDVPGEDHDHPHHRSLWFTHGDVNGVDFWTTDPLNKPSPKSHPLGVIRETSRAIVASGTVVGILQTTDDWLGPDGKRVCEDVRVVRFYDTAAARVLDFDVALKAGDGPVTFGDTKEGTLGLRVASSMDVVQGKTRRDGRITNAEGIADDAAWGKPSRWVDYVGSIEGTTVGIAILNHPESFRHPTTWHVRTYGLFAANPFGWHDFGLKMSGRHVLPEGQSLRFRYRIILHTGDTASAHVDEAFKGYAEPPGVALDPE